MFISEMYTAMHLLLVTETFDAKSLKALAKTNKSQVKNNPTIKRLESMFNACKKNNKLIDDSMLKYFPGEITIQKGKISDNLNMLDYAKYVTEAQNDRYCVYSATEYLAQTFSFTYGIDYIDEDKVNEAIHSYNINFIRKELDEAFPTHTVHDFIGMHYELLTDIQKSINYVKREEQEYVVRPETISTDKDQSEDIAKALRYSDYAKYSLQSFGEALAMICPVWIAVTSGLKNYDFKDFMADFPIDKIVRRYIKEARKEYGDCKSEKDVLKMMEDYTEAFYDPEEEPIRHHNYSLPIDDEDDVIIGSIEDIRDYFPEIAIVLFNNFYASK